MSNMEEGTLKPRPRGMMKWFFSMMMALLLCALIILGLQQFGIIRFPWEPEPVVAINVGGSIQEGVPGMTLEELRAALQEQADASSISFGLNFRPSFENGTAKGSLRFTNPPKNHYDMRVEVRLKSDGRLIYDTGLMPSNSHISGDKLFIPLAKGTYEATAHMLAFKPDDPETPVNRATAGITLTILN